MTKAMIPSLLDGDKIVPYHLPFLAHKAYCLSLKAEMGAYPITPKDQQVARHNGHKAKQ